MSRGWDRNGARGYDSSSHRLICANPPGPGAGASTGVASTSVLNPRSFRPNVFTGMYPYTAANPPLIAIGVADFSYEFWHHFRRQPRWPLGGNWWQFVGYCVPDWDWGCACWPEGHWLTPGVRAFYDADIGAPPAAVTTGVLTLPDPYGWHHYACNFDRSANLELFVDGLSLGTVAIDNINAGSWRFYALVTNSTSVADCDVSDDPAVLPPGETSQVHAFGVVGPVAAHASLLTPAQLRNSVRGKRVQNFATTVINWDWRNVESHTGWEIDANRIIAKATDFLTGVAAPLGANGTVVVPDASGNGNDYVLPTAETYGTVTADKANIGFIVDPFWMN